MFHIKYHNIKVLVLPFFIFVVLAIFSSRKTIMSPGIVIHHDWNVPPYKDQIVNYFANLRYVWQNPSCGRDASSVLYNAPSWLIFGSFALLGFDGESITKGIIIFSLALSGFSLYYMCISFKKSQLASLLAGIFYMFTPWIFNRIVAGTLDTFNYAIYPIAFLLFTKSIECDKENGRIRNALLAGVLASFPYAISTTLFGGLIVSYCIIDIAFSENKKSKTICCVRSLVLFFLAILAFYSFWILPWLVCGGGIGKPPLLLDVIVRSRNAQLINVIRLTGTVLEWYSNAITTSIWVIASFLLVFLVWAAPIVRRKDKKILFFSVVALVSIFLGKGVNPPASQLYEWALLNVPYFQVLRDPNKIVILTCLAYAYLLCESIQRLNQFSRLFTKRLSITKAGKHKLFRHLSNFSSMIVTVFVCSIILIFSQPFLMGNFASNGEVELYKNLEGAVFPGEYRAIYNWLAEQPDDFRVFWLPSPSSRILYDWAPFPQVDVMATFSPKPNFGGENNGNSATFANFLALTLNNGKTRFLGKLLGVANVKYVILRDDAKSWEWPWFLSGEQLNYIIEHQHDLDFIKKEGAINIFENRETLPHLFTTDSATIVFGGLSTQVSLSYLDDYSFNESSLFFLNQLSYWNSSILFERAGNVIVQDGSFFDGIFSFLPDAYKIDPSSYATEHFFDEGWSPLRWHWPYDWSYLDALEKCVLTSGKTALNLPFSVSISGDYEVWIKVFLGVKGTMMDVLVDHSKVGEVLTKSQNNLGFSWINLAPIHLSSGDHILSLQNAGEGENVVAGIAVAPKDDIEKAHEKVADLLNDKNIIVLFELEKLKLTENDGWTVSNQPEFDASQGLAMRTSKPARIRSSLFIPKNGNYEIYLRASGNSTSTTVISGEKFNVSLNTPNLRWHKLEEMYLERGNHSLSFISNDNDEMYLDQLLLKSANWSYEEPCSAVANFEYQKINPTKYTVHVTAYRPFFLVFSESFHNKWKAYVNGKSIGPILAYSFVNSYFIDETGELTITIHFINQRYYEIGLTISFLTFLAIIMFCVVEYTKSRTAIK